MGMLKRLLGDPPTCPDCGFSNPIKIWKADCPKCGTNIVAWKLGEYFAEGLLWLIGIFLLGFLSRFLP